ncbi:MAG: MATE family efflux transporter [Pseudomonadota bacterium]
MSHARDLTTGPLAGHFRALAVPTAVGMVFTTLTNVADMYFAGMLGTDEQAGLALSFQVFMVLVALGFGVSSAMSALVGNALGGKLAQRARHVANQGILFAITASVVFFIAGQLGAGAMLGVISEPGGARDAATSYLEVLLFSMPAFLLAYGANGVLTAQGDTVTVSRAQIGAFFANLVLNPLFIFGIPGLVPGLGFDGIALSTVVCYLGMLAWVLTRVMRSDVMREAQAAWRVDLAEWREIMAQAIPVSFAMIVMMIAGFVVQYTLKGFGPDAQAAYGVALRIEQILLLPAFGLTGALLPIAAQNLGADQFDRVRAAAWFCVRTGATLMLGAAVVLWLGGGLAMSIFSDDPRVVEIGASYLIVDGFILPLYVILFAINSLLQAFKKPLWTLVIGLYRQGFGVAFFIWLFVAVLDAGLWGVWIGIATSVVTGFLVSLIVLEYIARPRIGGCFAPQRAAVAPAGS